MTLSSSSSSSILLLPSSSLSDSTIFKAPRPFFLIPFLNTNFTTPIPLCLCRASNSQSGPLPKQSSSASKKRKKKGKGKGKGDSYDDDIDIQEDYFVDGPSSSSSSSTSNSNSTSSSSYLSYHPTTLPKPPAGFVLDDQGKLLMVSNKRIATIVDPLNNLPLDCVIRRIFQSSKGDHCMLLCPLDTPVQILKSKNIDGWSAVSDDEVEAILPTAAYALAKIHMHLVHSGFCYTARGGFCYSEDDIFDFRTDDGQDVDGLPTEGVEITCFHMDGAHYMIYTPSDPLLFVVTKDELGQLKIADDELLEDPAIISAIDEETEFNALVEEEAALLESVLGKE